MVINNCHRFLFFLLFFNAGCATVQHVSKTDVSYTVVTSETAPAEDVEINSIIAPYKLQLDAVMNEVIAVLPAELTKQKPESALGNWVSDVIVTRLRKDGYDVDLAVVNYGGLRVPYLSAGELTRGEVFELTPFDNTVMIVDVPGEKLDSFFLLIAENDGWPVSREAKLVISNKKVIEASVNGKPVDPKKIYKVATLDYVANGGDNMKVLIPLLRKETRLIFRDILIDYIQAATAEGRPIIAEVDGRIVRQ